MGTVFKRMDADNNKPHRRFVSGLKWLFRRAEGSHKDPQVSPHFREDPARRHFRSPERKTETAEEVRQHLNEKRRLS